MLNGVLDESETEALFDERLVKRRPIVLNEVLDVKSAVLDEN